MTPVQPTAVVTDADVERIARRDFAPAQADEVLALLNTYGAESWQREAPRVRAAILKLADGDIEHLRRELDVAKRDYRDVLVGAEYLAYGALTLRDPHPSAEDAQRAIDADWNHYMQWLKR
jgi:hypothetical protein